MKCILMVYLFGVVFMISYTATMLIIWAPNQHLAYMS